MKIIMYLLLAMSICSSALAHSGRTDKCGGHNDRKHGGYHVHNISKYCSCYPNSDLCKKSKSDKK